MSEVADAPEYHGGILSPPLTGPYGSGSIFLDEPQSFVGSGVWLTWVMTPLMKRASICSGAMP